MGNVCPHTIDGWFILVYQTTSPLADLTGLKMLREPAHSLPVCAQPCVPISVLPCHLVQAREDVRLENHDCVSYVSKPFMKRTVEGKTMLLIH